MKSWACNKTKIMVAIAILKYHSLLLKIPLFDINTTPLSQLNCRTLSNHKLVQDKKKFESLAVFNLQIFTISNVSHFVFPLKPQKTKTKNKNNNNNKKKQQRRYQV